MLEEEIHIQEGAGTKAACGHNLARGSFVPYLYTHAYHPSRTRYAVHRVLCEDEHYPVYEQVGVLDDIHFCGECLSCMGLALLRELA